MLCFVVLSNILLLTSLIAILSQVFTKVRPPNFKLHSEAFYEGDAPGFVTVYRGRMALDLKDWKLMRLIGHESRSGRVSISVSQSSLDLVNVVPTGANIVSDIQYSCLRYSMCRIECEMITKQLRLRHLGA